MYKLLELNGEQVIREHLLDGDAFRIGRQPGNDLQPDEPSVSGNHAVIRLVPNAYLDDAQDAVIEDLGSTNGTRVNGSRVTQQRLKHGDTIGIGAMRFRLVDEQVLAIGGTRILLDEDQV